jgi:hypothetical protein
MDDEERELATPAEVWAVGTAYEPYVGRRSRLVAREEVGVRPIEVPTRFRDFDDYWSPFLGGQGPAPGYAMALDEPRRAALREELRARLPVAADGSLPLVARARAVDGVPGPAGR